MTKTKLPTAAEIKEITGADQVTKNGDEYTIRRGFFYTKGMTGGGWATKVADALDKAGIAHTVSDSGEVWKAFNGGAPIQRQSHFWVRVILRGSR